MAGATPDTLLDSGSVFDQSKAQLGSWLRDNANTASVLSRDALNNYSGHSFMSGWRIEIVHRSDTLEFDVLLDAQFPYSPLRVALKSKDVYLKWPHVEPGGLLCLPSAASDVGKAADIGRTAISAALKLMEQCQSQDFINEEFRREFLSYWNRLKDTTAEPIRSLLDTRKHETRKIAVWHGKRFTLVGDTRAQVEAWLYKFGCTERSKIASGLFAYLAEAPSPPFPEKPNDLFALLDRHCPDASAALLKGFSVDQDITLVLGAGSPSGDGLVGIDLLRVSNTNGFRKGADLSVENKKVLWLARSRLQRRKVERFDAAWVHGRGLDKEQPVLAAAHVVVLGCGSLGSQVAMRLAQLGVGNLTLVDPQLLDAANVGRHALGIDSVGRAKASSVASEIRGRFPHIGTIAGVNSSWQDAYAKEPKIFGAASLIVACLGEWSGDGQLGEWQARFRPAAPIVYGWLDELGTAAHGVALGPAGPALDFILSGDGLRHPETLWNDEVRMRSEPACGTLFHPFGPIEVAKAEALVSRLCVDILTGALKPPVHRVYAGPTDQLIAAGGEWSAEHLKYRPPGYGGPFEYERPIKASDKLHGTA